MTAILVSLMMFMTRFPDDDKALVSHLLSAADLATPEPQVPADKPFTERERERERERKRERER